MPLSSFLTGILEVQARCARGARRRIVQAVLRIRVAATFVVRPTISVTLTLLVPFLDGQSLQKVEAVPTTVIETSAGDRREQSFGENTVNINQHSLLEVRETEQGYVAHLKRGVAGFQTREDPSFPFVVTTSHARIRGDNGLFGVRITPEGETEITVSAEGGNTHVQCRSPWSLWPRLSAGMTKRLTLHAGQSVYVTSDCRFRFERDSRSARILGSPRPAF